MVVSPAALAIAVRKVWLRRSASPHFAAPGTWHDLALSEIGNVAARETLATATLHFAAIWTDLFQDMIAPCNSLRWRDNGPGVGRDARIAYSSLIGRYVARAYLTRNEGVRVLVALDEAKRLFKGTPYRIEKDPPGRGLEADWVGLDGQGLVIAEAKSSSDKGIGTWGGPSSIPKVLDTAMGQAGRTAVFKNSTTKPLPAKRWAVASRWANEENSLDPTLLAWDPKEEGLDEENYRALAKILHRADLESVLEGLGHPEAVQTLNGSAPSRRLPRDLQIRSGGQYLEPGFSALVGPIGLHPLRNVEDLDRVRRIRDLSPNVALASLSSRYASTISLEPNWSDDEEVRDSHVKHPESAGRSAKRAGLTVVWPEAHEDIALTDD